MVQTPEREMPVKPEVSKEKPETAEVPPYIEREGSPVTQAPTIQTVTTIQDDQKKVSPAVSIQIPSTQEQLEEWSHGSPKNALTWFATFWLRLIKKALHFGWRIIGKVNPKSKG
jgi:hypothetical protein